MGKVVREVYYFDEPGGQNTEDVLEAVIKYIEESEVEYLIVESTSGKTASRFAEALKGKEIKVICVSEPPSSRYGEIGGPASTSKSETNWKHWVLSLLIVFHTNFIIQSSSSRSGMSL